MRYKLVKTYGRDYKEGQDKMEKKVSDLFDEGWECVGGIHVFVHLQGVCFTQAMAHKYLGEIEGLHEATGNK